MRSLESQYPVRPRISLRLDDRSSHGVDKLKKMIGQFCHRTCAVSVEYCRLLSVCRRSDKHEYTEGGLEASLV